MSSRSEWNEIADDFEELVCDVTADETGDQLRRFVGAARPLPTSSVLVDLGCGIGTFIERFGHRFRKVVAVEHAPDIIARARERCAATDDIEWLAMDVARAAKRIGPRADLTACLNVITSDKPATRRAQWSSLAAVTKPSGFALVVVPSLESEKMVQAHVRAAKRAAKPMLRADGLAEKGGAWQKHYRREELAQTIARQGFHVRRIGRVFQPWSFAGLDKPRAAAVKSPWDWICLARRAA